MSEIFFARATAADTDRLAWLDQVETQRYHRFRIDRAREEFLAGRLLLRQVLAERLGCAPAAVPIRLDAAGKPRLAGHDRLCFNLSHSAGTVLLALDDRLVGCDLQRIDPTVDSDRLAARWLQPEEAAALAAITDADERRQAFFRTWTMKEAVVKATGAGFAKQAGAFVVDPADHQPQVIRWRGEAQLNADYRVHPVAAGEESVASVVAVGGVRVVEGC